MSSSSARLSRPRARRAAPLAAAALAAASIAALVPAGEASAQGWLDGPAFAFPSTLPVMAVAPNGAASAVWIDGTDTYFQHAAPDGTTAPAQTLLPVAARPILTVGPSGAGAVVWGDAPTTNDGATPVDVTFVSPDGTPGRTVKAGSTPNLSDLFAAVDAAGDVTVVWSSTGGSTVAAARVATDGTVTAIPLDGASTASGSDPQVVVAPDGTAWIGWIDGTTPSDEVERIERVAPDGTAGPDAAVTDPGADPADVQLAANAAGGVAVWRTANGNGRVLSGVRLAATGSVTDGADLAIGTTPSEDEQMPAAPAIGPDGTISVLWTGDDGDGSAQGTTRVILSRFAPGGTTATEHTLATAPDASVEGWQQLAAAPDGTLLAEWLEMSSDIDTATGATVLASRIDAGGTIGPDATAGTLAFPPGLALLASALVHPFVDEVGGGLVQLLSVPDGNLVTSTRRLDAAGPVVTADVPATAAPGVPVAMSATASDPTGASAPSWDFGDGSATASGASVQHAWAAPGTYTVTVTATDGVQNTTVVRKQVTVTAPADTGTGGSGPTGIGPSSGGTTGPGPDVGSGGPESAHVANPAPAKLKIANATRTGAKVTVTGTIAKTASGRVTVTYTVKSGRRTVTKKMTARIVKGRWSASFKLTGKLATKAALKAKATVAITYAGNAHAAKASAKHAVRTAKATPTKRSDKPRR